MEDDDRIMTIMGMGFDDVDDVKKALRLGNNDINEAVAILTNEHATLSLNSDDVEMVEDPYKVSPSQIPTVAPPPYDMSSESVKESSPSDAVSSPVEFPTTNLYELESRVFVDRWSIPYKKEESLGKCLIGAIYFAEQGLCEADENCRRFIEYCMPEAFTKLLTSPAVRTWAFEVHEGVLNMIHLFINLVISRLKYDPVSIPMLQVLEKAFDPDSEFYVKNKNKESTSELLDILSVSTPFAVTRDSLNSYSWLVEVINKFGHQGGFREIQNRFNNPSITGTDMAALLLPLAKCAEYLNPTRVLPFLSSCMDTAVLYVKSLSDDDIKSKNICSISELLKAMKLLCLHLWPHKVTLTNSLCLEVILRMLKCPHFNARMNGLKEVTKLIDDVFSGRSSKTAIDSEELLNWLSENEVLSIALEGNIDQVQYTDKIKGIIEFIGHRLSLDELNKIWNMQNGQNAQIVDNIHTIMYAASSQFNSEQFDHLLTLIQGTCENSSDQMKKRLISFIGRIGKGTNQGKSSAKILDLLWDLVHSSSLPMPLVEQALEEHFSILCNIPQVDQTKKQYYMKCIEDIKKGVCVLPSMKLLRSICENILKSGVYKQDRIALNEFNKAEDVIKLVSGSLARCHKLAVAAAGDKPLNPSVLVDGLYTHEDYLVEHLNFLQFLLQDGAQYLQWSRAKEIWDCLVSNVEACESDKEICFEWFNKCLQDLESETQSQLFQQKLLKLDPSKITCRGFSCFKTYFESVNSSEHKLRRSMLCLVVEKLDLIGVDFLWQVALSSDESISDAAIHYLLDVSYHALAPKLKKDLPSLHKRFMQECYRRLEMIEICQAVAGQEIGGTAMFTAMSSATKTLTAMSVSEAASCSSATRSAKVQSICRLLQIAERYISSIEETHNAPRTISPHGTFFLGRPIFLKIEVESTKEELVVVTHSNESLELVKQRIAQHIKQPSSQLQILHDALDLSKEKNQRLMGQFHAIEEHILTVKCPTAPVSDTLCTQDKPSYNTFGSGASSSSSSDVESPEGSTWANLQSIYLLEQEKQLPGVVMASGGQVFSMLYNLIALDDPKITFQVRNILHLIPTDPATLDALDSICAKKVIEISSSETSKGSPRTSPKKFTITSPSKEKLEGPKDILRNLFDVTASVSPFKLLYNLEVLSGKLMPVSHDAGTMQSAEIFRNDFMGVGGLKLILNILKKDSIPNDVDYGIMQGCYLTAITISRYLLCNQTGLEISNMSPLSCYVPSKESVVNFFVKAAHSSSSGLDTEKCSHMAIEELSQDELLDVLLSLMRIAWAAAAGNLHLANCTLPSKEGHFYGGRRSRQDSSGSSASSGSESGDAASLHGGVCGQIPFVSYNDSYLSQKALKFLVLALELRPDVFCAFSKLQCNRDFIIDMLLGSPSSEVRSCALEQFFKLSHLKRSSVSAKHYLLQILLKAHLPLWVSSSCIRGANQRLLSQCKEFFELACSLLDGLTEAEQKSLQIDAKQMIEDEITWLQGFSPSSLSALRSADSALMTGHFKFVKTLLRCEGVKKEEVGKILVSDLLQSFLFPASYLISAGATSSTNSPSLGVSPKCVSLESRVAAYDVLVELSTDCAEILEKIVKQLLSMHHFPKPEMAKEFDYEPLVSGRAHCGYVGLKNAGATCYMNSVIQQLYMQPGIKEYILSVEEDDPDEEGLFYQFQKVFGHLLESRLEYHTPETFWRHFRLWGEPINVREQQDAFEFFTHVIDQIDEHLTKNKLESVFKQKYEGVFSDQKICQGCPHRFEREETFMALNLPVKSHSLLDSLDQFVKGELLEGQNSYFCEKCHEKRNAIKRMCIKTLPPVLVIQLKRFDYDWEANRSLKFDDYFKFPWHLEMAPYTVEGVMEREFMKSETEDVNDNQVVPSSALTQKIGNTMYELVGVVVHSGQANAGHYYSYIKERRPDSGTNFGKWFKFNDTSVEEVEMDDAMLEAECFGGSYKAKVRDSSYSQPEKRQRYWNAYLIFYERMEDVVRTPRTPRKNRGKFSFRRSENDGSPGLNRNLLVQSPSNPTLPYQRDSLSQLTRLVDRGEKHGLFVDKMPVRIQQVVREENLQFMHNCDIYNDSYFSFILKLTTASMNQPDSPNFVNCTVNSILPLSVNFLFNTYLRYKNKTSCTMSDWVILIESAISRCKEAAFHFIDFLASDTGLSYFKPFLLECPNREARQVFSRVIEKAITYFFSHGGEAGSPSLDRVLVHLLDMLNQDVPGNCRSCCQYFGLLCTYAQLGTKTCAHLLANNAFQKFLIFLLGPAAADMQNEGVYPRRWNPVQTQDFGSLHAAMALLILNCDLVPHRTCDPENFKVLQSVWASSDSSLLPMPEAIKSALYGKGSHRYIQEVVSACREVGGSISVFVDMLTQCCFCNEPFSTSVIHQVMIQYSTVPSNELKNLSYLLLEIIAVEDPLQFFRIRLIVDGCIGEKNLSFSGILAIIRANQANDSRRSYQGVKFLVSSAHRCPVAKEYLMQSPNKWHWSVNWLKKMMSELSTLGCASSVPLSNEDSNTKNFQRTVSAQDTLDEATALLTAVDSPEGAELNMEVEEDQRGKELVFSEASVSSCSTPFSSSAVSDSFSGYKKSLRTARRSNRNSNGAHKSFDFTNESFDFTTWTRNNS